MPGDLDLAANVACSAAREAGALIRENFGKVVQVDFKGDVNPVTATDTAAERIILQRLHRTFPDHYVLGEESGGSSWQSSDLAADHPIWLVDPLDGTNNFAHGFPHIAVSLGLRVAGKVQIGVIYDPLRDDLFLARRGRGATWNGTSIHVSQVERLADAFLATGFPYSRRVAADNNTQRLDWFLRRCQGVRRAGSAALDMAYVAWGRFDGFWEPELSPWDLAAGVLLVEEAGGRVSDFSGDTERLASGQEVVVSNGCIHDEMLIVLREGAGAPHPDFPSLG